MDLEPPGYQIRKANQNTTDDADQLVPTAYLCPTFFVHKSILGITPEQRWMCFPGRANCVVPLATVANGEL